MNVGNLNPNPISPSPNKKSESIEPSSVIRIGERRDVLVNKLEEYRKRIGKHLSPADEIQLMYRIAILEELIKTGEVSADALLGQFMDTFRNVFNLRVFKEAYKIVKDYAETGGKNLVGGTGLSQTRETR